MIRSIHTDLWRDGVFFVVGQLVSISMIRSGRFCISRIGSRSCLKFLLNIGVMVLSVVYDFLSHGYNERLTMSTCLSVLFRMTDLFLKLHLS